MKRVALAVALGVALAGCVGVTSGPDSGATGGGAGGGNMAGGGAGGGGADAGSGCVDDRQCLASQTCVAGMCECRIDGDVFCPGSDGGSRNPRMLRTCDDPAGVSCPEMAWLFPSSDALNLPGTAYSDTIPDTLDLASWAGEYLHGALQSMLPSQTILDRPVLHPGKSWVWVPDNSFAPGLMTVFSESATQTVDGVAPNAFCDGAMPACIDNEAVPQWPIWLQTVLRAREMAGNAVSADDAARELASLRGVFARDQRSSLELASSPPQWDGGTVLMTSPFSYTVMLLAELQRQYPSNALVAPAGEEYLRYLRAIATPDGPYLSWFQAQAGQVQTGIEGNGGYYNEYFIQVGAQAYLAMGFALWHQVTKSADANALLQQTVDYLRNYGGGAFWANPDTNRFKDDNPPFVGHTLAYIPAYNAMVADAQARVAVNPADPIARVEVSQAQYGYDFMKQRGTAGVLGHFGVSSVLGQMMELGARLASLRTAFPDLVPYSTGYEDIERWIRNQAAELRFDASLAQYVGDATSTDLCFDHVISRSLGTFISDDAHPMMLPTFDFMDDNDGLWLMRGLYDAWRSAVEVNDTNGVTVAWVNLDLNAATRFMDVYSDLPYRGRVEVALRPDIGAITVLAIRVPSWAGQSATVTEDGVAITRWSWNDRYVVIQGVQPGKRYAVRFPMVVQHPPITQLHSQNDWWNEADFGSYQNPELPVQYTGTMIGDTLVSSTFAPTGGLPRYVRPQLSALIQNDAAVERAPPTRSAQRFVFNATVQQGPGWTP